jgi:hypothetical protein
VALLCDAYLPAEDMGIHNMAQAARQVDICLAAETARREAGLADHYHHEGSAMDPDDNEGRDTDDS